MSGDEPTQQSRVTGSDPLGWLPERLGPARLVRLLGAGAMGTVYLAEMVEDRPWAKLGTQVAVKVLDPGLHREAIAFQRFLREAQVGTAFEHPSVVRTYATDSECVGARTHHFLFLEYVEGQTLRDLMEQMQIIPEALLRDLAIQVARGLAAVHATGVVHRDLKPANVLITPDHRVKLMDLGVAGLAGAGARLTHAGDFVGSPAYAAPEQFTSSALGPATDLYALGVVLYESATGTHPFAADGMHAVMRRHLDHVPARIGHLNPQVTPFFETVVATLLLKSPAARIADAGELADILEAGEASSWWHEQEGRRAAHAVRELRRPAVRRETSLVGRETELAMLRSLCQEAQEGQGHLLILEGEAGVGKTRLLDEFVRLLEDESSDLNVLYGSHSPADAGAAAVGALGEAVVSHFGDWERELKLEPYLGATPRLVRAFSAMVAGEPAPDGSESLSTEALHAVFCHLARNLADERPTVWIVDDLHFATSLGRDLLWSLARIARDQRLFLIATTRPGLPAEVVANLERLPHTRRHVLSRLSRKSVVRLLREACHSESLADQIGDSIAAKSDGNAFFVLELIRGLQESGILKRLPDGAFIATRDVATALVPSSVRGLLLSRLKDLDESDRALLEVGAVQGFSFEPDLIARVLERERLEVLQVLARLERHARLIRATGAGFQFDHHLLQELIYEGLPPVLRREYHALLADALEKRAELKDELGAGLGGEKAVQYVRHALKGRQPMRGRERILPAIQHLAETYQNDALLEISALALEQEELVPELTCDLHLRRAACFELLGRRSEERASVEAAIAVADAAGDAQRGARARRALGWNLLSVADHQGARVVLEDAIERAVQAGDRETLAQATGNLGKVLLGLAEYAEARDCFEQSLELARESSDLRAEAEATGQLGGLCGAQGDYDEARKHYERFRDLSRGIGDRRGEATATANLVGITRMLGKHEEALKHAGQGLTLCREIGYRRGEAAVLANAGSVLVLLGQYTEARQRYQAVLELHRDIGDPRGECLALANLGALDLNEGRLEEAEQHLNPCEALSREFGDRRLLGHALLSLGELADGRRDQATAGRYFSESLALRRSLGESHGVATSAFALGRHLLAQGEQDPARTLLLEAESLADEISLADIVPLPTAYLALLGDRDPATIQVEDSSPVATRAEAHRVLYQAGGGPEHLRIARSLLEQFSAHLQGAEREAFWANLPAARDLLAEETLSPPPERPAEGRGADVRRAG